MTEEEQLFLVDLKANTKQFFKIYKQLEVEKLNAENRATELSRQIETLKKEKSELNEKIEQLRLATHLLSGVDENREAKRKINKLVREIDKCIALLNR
jgi:uncharacterized coiled-coil DUF342 family protein